MRSLKRIPGPKERLIYTLENKGEQAKSKILCDHCGARDAAPGYEACKIYKDLHDNSHEGIKLLVRTCPDFEPLLTFRPPLIGFEGEFNTFRLGTAWYYRIGPDVRTALVDTSTNTIFAKAIVTDVFVGSLAEMCDEHAYMNHTMIGLDQDDASQKMRKVIKQVYGMAGIDDSSQMTVIYLRNLNGADDQLEGEA